MSKLNPNYIVGLIDGEGSFTCYIRNSKDKKNVKRRVVAEPRFYVKLVERDKDILYQLKDFFGCGNVYFQIDNRKNHQNCYRYEVANRSHLKDKIIPFFQKYSLRIKSKKKDFDIFCRIIESMNKGKHLEEKGLIMLYKLKQQMH